MRFVVLPVNAEPPAGARSTAYLMSDDWNDYWEFRTQYYLMWCDSEGARHDIGNVKIGQFGMSGDQSRPSIPEWFEGLDWRFFFSLGQDPSYYEALNKLDEEGLREDILRRLGDLAIADDDRLTSAFAEQVARKSLMRDVPMLTVVQQFRRLAHGGARLSEYQFAYAPPRLHSDYSGGVELEFGVIPDATPPSNVHVLIGRNGVGKTTMLGNMARSLADSQSVAEHVGYFRGSVVGSWPFGGASHGASSLFANVISVAFSAFDKFQPPKPEGEQDNGVGYSYVGLLNPRVNAGSDTTVLSNSDSPAIEKQFSDSVVMCVQGARRARWRAALSTLESDPLFRDYQVSNLALRSWYDPQLKSDAAGLYEQLSSGHKIVLLTVTRLVEVLEERSLVLVDEPEAHLHPPLLSAFIRVLSNLLTNRNGVAIVATHSPVVLQEVPRSCVWNIRRSGAVLSADRPEIETFGENVGVLTREIFGLEVEQSGFHAMLSGAVEQGGTFEEISARFGGELGGEARVILRTLLAAKRRGEIG